MDWLKKHFDTMATIATLVASMAWMNSSLVNIEHRLTGVEVQIAHIEKRMDSMEGKLTAIDKEVGVMKTVLIMKRVMSQELCVAEEG